MRAGSLGWRAMLFGTDGYRLAMTGMNDCRRIESERMVAERTRDGLNG